MDKRNYIRDPSLVLYLPLWKLDGDGIRSEDAYGRLCTVIAATWGITGRIFDGSTSYINLNNTFADVAGSTTKTLIVWIKASKTNYTTAGDIVSLLRTTGTRSFILRASSNPGVWTIAYVDGTTARNLSSGTFTQDQWYFLAATQNGVGVSLYVDTTIYTATNAGVPTMVTPTNALIGADQSTAPQLFFSGTIGDVLIYNRALTPHEIQRIYLTTKWRYK